MAKNGGLGQQLTYDLTVPSLDEQLHRLTVLVSEHLFQELQIQTALVWRQLCQVVKQRLFLATKSRVSGHFWPQPADHRVYPDEFEKAGSHVSHETLVVISHSCRALMLCSELF